MDKYRNKSHYTGPFELKGSIANSSDFPTLAEVQNGWAYIVAGSTIDNDPSKTNTGQEIPQDDNGIVWKDGEWLFFQIIEAQQETDNRWTCVLINANTKFTLPNPNRPNLIFNELYELLVI